MKPLLTRGAGDPRTSATNPASTHALRQDVAIAGNLRTGARRRTAYRGRWLTYHGPFGIKIFTAGSGTAGRWVTAARLAPSGLGSGACCWTEPREDPRRAAAAVRERRGQLPGVSAPDPAGPAASARRTPSAS